jgi:hypothetical protein
MDKIRDHIGMLKTLAEDPSVQPQHAIAYTNKMAYYALLVSKDTYIFNMQNQVGLKNKPRHTEYFISCIKMEEADQNECACAPNIECTWMRSVDFLPKFKGEKLGVVKPVDTINTDDYGFIHWNDAYDLRNSRHSSRLDNKYSIRNVLGKQRLYIHTLKKVKPQYVSILAPFDDIFELIKFMDNDCGCKEIKCNFLDREMDLPAEHKMAILQQALQFLRQMADQGVMPDRSTDDVDGSKRVDMV